jgi:UDP-3-O-[3-hydroxymyristoyl] glucosamine N-acyltransferase
LQHPGFFCRRGPFPLRAIANSIGAELINAADGEREIDDLRPLSDAGPKHLTFFDSRRLVGQLATTHAAACLVRQRGVELVPSQTAAVRSETPHQAFALALQFLYPDALRSKVAASAADSSGKLIHRTAEIADGAVVESGAIIGPEARIGSGTVIAAGAVIGFRVYIGSDCYVGACASVTHALIGDRVILHSGVRIGQDGFGFVPGPLGHQKIPQIGRVIVGDDVEIGANSTVDRGFIADTIIGEGTKIDNLVQIGHNVVIGRHCIIVAQSGIAGSARLGDFVVMGAHSGVVGHVNVGDGAQIAGTAHVKNDVGAGLRMGGTPARPFNDWAREIAAVKRLGQNAKPSRLDRTDVK